METGDFLVNLALQSWQLDAGSLWELLNLSTDKGIMVTVRLASSRDGNTDSDLLDLSVHQDMSAHQIPCRVKRNMHHSHVIRRRNKNAHLKRTTQTLFGC